MDLMPKKLNHVPLLCPKFQSETEISSRRLLQLYLSLMKMRATISAFNYLIGAGEASPQVNFPVLKLPSAQSIDQTAGSNDENSRIEPKLTLNLLGIRPCQVEDAP